MRKAVWTLNLENSYAPEITSITYPYIKAWADKIDAEFRLITERQYPGAPATYEKLQLFHLGEDYDWNIYIDSDALIHPDLFDPTVHIHPDTVMQYGSDLVGTRFKIDKYFMRDGRFISSCNWFTMASKECLDLWHPLEDMSMEQALSNIKPQLKESPTCSDGHLIDDYVLSRNISRYGLKYKTFLDLLKFLKGEAQFLFHSHLLTRAEKAYVLPRVMEERWKEHLPIDYQWLDKTLKDAKSSIQ